MKAASSGFFCGRRAGQRMIGRDRHELAPNSVSGRVVKTSSSLSPFGAVFGIEREAHQQALRAADPVVLHQAHLLRPAVERVERVEQLLGDSR